jgi:hypothetical protein
VHSLIGGGWNIPVCRRAFGYSGSIKRTKTHDLTVETERLYGQFGLSLYICARRWGDRGPKCLRLLIRNPPPGSLSRRSFHRGMVLCSSTRAKFPASFAADVQSDKAAFVADSQVPWGVEVLSGAALIGQAARGATAAAQ